jgi:2-methylcitrate dehydratase PrpD
MTTKTIVRELAEFSAGVRFADLPAEAVKAVEGHLLDTLGVCLAARRLETSGMALQLARGWGGSQDCSVVGFSDRVPPASAAFVNGVLAHSLDFDDTHLPSVLHPSASVVPAALAVGEEVGCSGQEMIAALAVGYEIVNRTGMAAYDRELGNSIFFERGWHATSICGTLAAATLAAKLYGLDAEKISHALGIAVSMGAGVIEGNRTGGSVKRLHCGWAGHAGIIAAQAARAGFTGPAEAFEGTYGFYKAFCGGLFHIEELLNGLGSRWSVTELFYKPYPANHFSHAAIDAALRLRSSVEIRDIAEIEVGLPTSTLRTLAQPADAKARPQSGYHAQFSAPFIVATALLGGGGLGVWLNDFTDERVRDPRYLDLAAKVRCVPDAECDAIFPRQFPAVMTIKTHSGKVLNARITVNRGGPGNPLSTEELKIKFNANAGITMDQPAADLLADAAINLHALEARDLAALVRGGIAPARV